MRQPAHILLDFFGTLAEYRHGARDVDPVRTLALLRGLAPDLESAGLSDAIEAACQAHEAQARATLREYHIHAPMQSLLRSLGIASAEPSVGAVADAWIQDWLAKVGAVPGVGALLASIPVPKTVVSNTNTPGLVEGLCASFEIAGHLAGFVTSIQLGVRKPHESVYRAALARAASEPGEVLFVGDDPACDYFGPSALGIRAVLVSARPVAGVPEHDRIESILGLGAWIAERW